MLPVVLFIEGPYLRKQRAHLSVALDRIGFEFPAEFRANL